MQSNAIEHAIIPKFDRIHLVAAQQNAKFSKWNNEDFEGNILYLSSFAEQSEFSEEQQEREHLT